MTFASSNREALVFATEVTWGTNPAGTPQALNFTNTTLGNTNEATTSNFVRSDTNRAGVIRTNVNAAGNVGIELQYGAYDNLLLGALRNSAWPTALNVAAATTISAVASDNSIRGTGTEFTNAVQGQWIRVSGFATAANNGYAKVITKSSVLKIIVAGLVLANESAGPAVTVKGTVIKNSTTDVSYSFERQFTDISQYGLFTGMRVSQFSLSMATASIVTGAFGFIGKTGTYAGSSGFSAATAAATTDSMNTISNIQGIYIDNVLSTGHFLNADFTLNTGAQQQKALGTLGSAAIRTGAIDVTGTLGAYFEDLTYLNKLSNFTAFGLSIIVADAANNAYVFDFPAVHLTTGSPDNQGIDQTLTIPAGFTSTLSATDTDTIAITRIPAP